MSTSTTAADFPEKVATRLPATDEFWDLLPDLVPQDVYYDDPADYR